VNTLLEKAKYSLPAFLLLVGCAGPRMVPPDDVAKDSRVLEVKDRSNSSGMLANESFGLGDYKVSKVNRKAISEKKFSISKYQSNGTTTGYTYEFANGADQWNGACAYSKDEKGFSMGGLGSFSKAKSSLTCECTPGASGKGTGRLELKSGSDKMTGTMSCGGESYEMTPVDKTDKKSFAAGPAGYRFDAKDGPRGAVEVLHPGRLWLDEKLAENEREPTSCVLTGLMLYVEPTEH
jgi:hypothetical protein